MNDFFCLIVGRKTFFSDFVELSELNNYSTDNKADIHNSFDSDDKYDVIHSMEVLYYLDDPSEIIKKISDSWLNNNGRLIVGVDHYYENTDSHSWQEKVGTRMLMLRESEWINIFEKAGLNEVQSWRSGKDKDWAGTLVITGKK